MCQSLVFVRLTAMSAIHDAAAESDEESLEDGMYEGSVSS